MAKSGKKVSGKKAAIPAKGAKYPKAKPTPRKAAPPKGRKRPAWSDPIKPTKSVSGGETLAHSKRRGTPVKPDPRFTPEDSNPDLTVAPGKPQKQNVRRIRPDNPTTDKDSDNQPDEARSVMQGGSDVNDEDKVQTDEADDDDRTSLDDTDIDDAIGISDDDDDDDLDDDEDMD